MTKIPFSTFVTNIDLVFATNVTGQIILQKHMPVISESETGESYVQNYTVFGLITVCESERSSRIVTSRPTNLQLTVQIAEMDVEADSQRMGPLM